MAESSAVRLFAARAAAASPGFTVSAENAEAVATICRRMDGIPLALELASTRVRVLGPAELAARLDDRFGLLVGGPRDAPARQRTLKAVIDWSWDLLTGAERAVLRRLAVHRDGCGLEAAEALCAGGGVKPAEVVDLLARLTDRSLVAVSAGGPPRYRLLESVSAYCLERLPADEHAALLRAHARYYTALAERADAHLRGGDQRSWLRRLDAETANLRAALEAADAPLAERLVRAMAWYWFLRGRFTEAKRSLVAALRSGADPAALSAWLAGMTLLSGEPWREKAPAEAAPQTGGRPDGPHSKAVTGDGQAGLWPAGSPLRVAVGDGQAGLWPAGSPLRVAVGDGQAGLWPAGSPLRVAVGDGQAGLWPAGSPLRVAVGDGQAGLWPAGSPLRVAVGDGREEWLLGYAETLFGSLEAGEEHNRRALEGFRARDDRWGVAAAVTLRGLHRHVRGDLAGARRDAEEGLALFASSGDQWGLLQATAVLGRLAEIEGDYREAEDRHREGLALAEHLDLWGEASVRWSELGRIALLSGDPARADELHERGRRLAVRHADRRAQEFAEVGLALSARRRGRFEEAEKYLRTWLEWNGGFDAENGSALILAELGFLAEQRGDPGAALDLHERGLAAAEATGDPRAIALAHEGLAGAHLLAGRHGEAARLLAAASRMRAEAGAPLPPAERGDVDRITAALRAVLGEDAAGP
ncbi:ATP-binding protein [Nocardiopsis composta]